MNTAEEFPEEKGIGVVVVCEGGSVYTSAGGKVRIKDADGTEMEVPKPHDSEDIFANFISAVKSRKVEDQYADCEETHISSALCHTGMISHRLGEMMSKGQIMEQLKGDKVMEERFGSMADHLKANGVDVNTPSMVHGPMIKFNPDTEWAEGNGELDKMANKLVTRDYRAPFIVPEVL